MIPTQTDIPDVGGEEPPDPEDPFPKRIACICVAFTLSLLSLPALAQQSGSATSNAQKRVVPTSQADTNVLRAIEGGLDYLANRQNEDGKFSANYSVAITSLAGLAFLGNGVQYDRGKHGQALSRAVRYLLDISYHDNRPGYLTDSGSRMHGHAYAMLFLTQVLGSMPTPALEAKLRKRIKAGIELIARSQTHRGGWGYTPGDEFDEASITVCCLQALRAAKDAGISVKDPDLKTVVDLAVRYLKDSCLEDGSFRYSLARNVDRPSYELTAAAVSTLDAAGEYAAKEHALGIAYMQRVLESYRGRPLSASSRYLYYGNLYAAQVFYQQGGEAWDAWYPAARRQLLAERGKNAAHWDDQKFGTEYSTAIALLILEVPLSYLPIFER